MVVVVVGTAVVGDGRTVVVGAADGAVAGPGDTCWPGDVCGVVVVVAADVSPEGAEPGFFAVVVVGDGVMDVATAAGGAVVESGPEGAVVSISAVVSPEVAGDGPSVARVRYETTASATATVTR